MTYVDLCLKPRGVEEATEMAKMLARMGVRFVGVEADDPKLLKPFIDAGVKALRRVTVEAETASEALKAVRDARRRFEIVAVRPKGVEAARFAARDSRVDVVVLTPGMARYMDRSEARLMRIGGGVIEIPLSRALERGDRGLRGLMIIARRATAYDTPFTVSTCATSRWDLWHPQSIRGLLVSLGVPEHHAKLAVTAYPLKVIVSRMGVRS